MKYASVRLFSNLKPWWSLTVNFLDKNMVYILHSYIQHKHHSNVQALGQKWSGTTLIYS